MEQAQPKEFYITLIEDEPRIHEMILDILGQAKLIKRFESFYDPFSFIEFLKKSDAAPDLILLDVHFENSGLSGVEIIPFIREDHPYVPIILLTGMDGEAIEQAHEYECIYYIPKPVSPEHLVRMVRFYMETGRKSGMRTAEISQDLARHKELVQALKLELAEIEVASWDAAKEEHGRLEPKACRRIMEILQMVLKNCELMSGVIGDLEKLFESDFQLFKKAVDTIMRFDSEDISIPGMHVHKYHSVDYVYSVRVTQKARLFFYQPPHLSKKRLVRLDPDHDDKAMGKWLKTNYEGFSGSKVER